MAATTSRLADSGRVTKTDQSPREIIAAGCAENDVKRVIGLLKRNEYKRRQAPPGVRVTERGFGKDWRYPITNRYRDED